MGRFCSTPDQREWPSQLSVKRLRHPFVINFVAGTSLSNEDASELLPNYSTTLPNSQIPAMVYFEDEGNNNNGNQVNQFTMRRGISAMSHGFS